MGNRPGEGVLLLALTFLITVLLLLKAGILLFLLPEQLLLQLSFLVGLEEQVREWVGRHAGGAGPGDLGGRCAGTQLFLREVLSYVLLIQQWGPEPHLLIAEVLASCAQEAGLGVSTHVQACMCVNCLGDVYICMRSRYMIKSPAGDRSPEGH